MLEQKPAKGFIGNTQKPPQKSLEKSHSPKGKNSRNAVATYYNTMYEQ